MCTLVLLVSVFGKDGAETCVCKDTCLGEAVHPFVDLHHDMSMFNEGETRRFMLGTSIEKFEDIQIPPLAFLSRNPSNP